MPYELFTCIIMNLGTELNFEVMNGNFHVVHIYIRTKLITKLYLLNVYTQHKISL
jgi:hypothetical protein